MTKLRPSYVVQLRHQRRLTHFAEMLARGLRQSKPVMPVAQHVLHTLEFSDELLALGGRFGKLGSVARPFAQNAILMQQCFGDGRVSPRDPLQHPAGYRQRITACFRTKVLAGAFQPLANLSDRVLLDRFSQLLFLPAAEFDQMIHQLRLAPRLPRPSLH